MDKEKIPFPNDPQDMFNELVALLSAHEPVFFRPLTESEISAIEAREAQEYETRCREAKRDCCICDCCGHSLDNMEQNGSYFGYVTCPNCSYIQHIPNCFNIGSLNYYYVVDQEGNGVLDHNGQIRKFANRHIAKEYIRYCKMEDKWNFVEADVLIS